MATYQKTVFVDEEVASRVLDIVQEARQYVIITTPYLKLWRHAQTALALAVKRGVKVTVIVRSEKGVLENWDDVNWLMANGVRVLAAEYLHAKIYLNEHAVIVSSMNLHEFSTKNSLEIGMVVQEAQAGRQVRDYVKDTLMVFGTPVSAPPTEPSQRQVNRPTQPQPSSPAGTCIRCGRRIFPNPEKPLCDDCYDVWAQYGDEDYPEQCCFACGRPEQVTYAKPLCRTCFQMLRSMG